jgi:hypothetical protein
MNNASDRPTGTESLRIFETGVRIALEKMLTGRDYAGVEDILRALADGSSLPATNTEPPTFASSAAEYRSEGPTAKR